MPIVHKDADLSGGLVRLAEAIAGDAIAPPRSGSDVDSHRVHSKGTYTAELTAAVEQFATAGENNRHTAFHALVERMKEAEGAGRFEELAVALRLALAPTLDYTSVQSLNRFYKALPPVTRGRSKIRLAILGGFTTH